ncbi:hypothetical protein B0H13DRAFT_2311624 [Mycena leptocephala]|nr:hypothetical protein B0H13DRAFT_2311624 [Mycena leptocephala]
MLLKSSDTFDKILQYTAVVADTLRDVADTSQIPFLDSVCTLVLTIVPIVQGMKLQKDRCLSMMEKIHQLLCALMSLYIHSDLEIRSPQMLDHIAQFSLTLQKFYSGLRAQRELGKIKRLFKQNEIIAQLDSCEIELQATLKIFTSGSIDNASSIGRGSLNASSGSLSLLPAHPKIFHGLESELKDLIDALLHGPARVAILGPGGMGKTTLAMAALHHPAIWEKYNLKHFISCESASTCGDLVASIGLHLGLEPSRQLSKAIVRHLGQCGPCLVVLDNFETPWESIESRAQVEEFISLLADIPSFALLVTMRGAERPGKVKWNRPFLPPLEPLSPSASRQIFIEVADEPESGEQSALNDLLELSGSLPLAVSLMANIASFEGYSSTLTRWETENTALLSEGHDKRSNLEKSISLSLRSPRISSSPDAKNLISLLSLLPDGIRPEDIFTSKVPIPNARQCQSVLIGTSLAYLDVKGRLKALSPVREYIRRAYPPSVSLVRPLRTYFQNLLEVWESNRELPSGDLVPDLISHLGNINQLILAEDVSDPLDWYHAHALCGMVEMDILMEGETADVLSNLNAAKAIYIAVDSPRIVWCSAVAAKINLLRGDTENARVAFLKCLSKSRGIFPDIVRDSLAALADPRHKMHGPMDSFRWAMVYFAFAQKANKPADRLDALQRLADIYLLMGDDETALHLFQAALEGGTKMGIHRLRAECMARIGDIMLRRRDTMSAMDMWEAAHPLFIRSSCRKDAALVEERIQKLSQSLLAIRDGTGETSTTSAQVVLPSTLKQLEALSAPNISLSLQLETDDDPGTSPGEKTELFAP